MLEDKQDRLGIRIAILLIVLVPIFPSIGLAAPEHAHWGLSAMGGAYFVDNGTMAYLAQSFVADTTETLTAIKGEYAKIVGVRYDLIIEIRADLFGSPDMGSEGLLGRATVANSDIWDWAVNGWPTGEDGVVQKTLSPAVDVTFDTTYWIVWKGTGIGSFADLEFVDVVYHGNHESSGMGVYSVDYGVTWYRIVSSADFVYQFIVEGTEEEEEEEEEGGGGNSASIDDGEGNLTSVGGGGGGGCFLSSHESVVRKDDRVRNTSIGVRSFGWATISAWLRAAARGLSLL